MSSKSLNVCLLAVIFVTGCQTGKWSAPKFPKMADWKTPRLFAKKSADNLAPPSRHFDESERIASDSNAEPTTHEEAPGLPSRALTPYSPETPKSVATPKVSDGFTTPGVGGADPTNNLTKPSGIRTPYDFKSESGSLLDDAGKMVNQSKRNGADAISPPGGTNNDFVAAPIGRSTDTSQFGKSDSLPTTPLNNGFAAGSSGSTLGPPTTLNPANNSNSTDKTDSTLPQVNYPKTAQGNNGFESLSPRSNPAQPQKIPNQFFNEELPQGKVDKTELVVQSNADQFPQTKSQSYVLSQRSESQSAPEARVAKIPSELKVQGTYQPGSTKRVAKF